MKRAGLVLTLLFFCVLAQSMVGCGEGTWTNLGPTGDLPSARSTSMVCDAASAKVILFGGHAMERYPDTACGDTWAYDPTANTWTNLHPAGDVPSARQGHSMTYDSASGKVILFGGWNGGADFNDTWAYDPETNEWTNLKPSGDLPPAASAYSVAYDSTSDKVILFGGISGEEYPGTCHNDTWAYDPTANTWTNLHPAGSLPPVRWGAPMVYDPDADKVILFGGGDSGSTSLGDTWGYDLAANTGSSSTPAVTCRAPE